MQRVVQVLLNMRNAANQNVFQKHPINRIDHWFSEVCLQIWLQSRLKSNSLFEFWFLGRDLSFNDFAIAEKSTSYSFKFEVRSSNCESFDSSIVLLFFIDFYYHDKVATSEEQESLLLLRAGHFLIRRSKTFLCKNLFNCFILNFQCRSTFILAFLMWMISLTSCKH